MEGDQLRGQMEGPSLRFVDPALEDRFQRHGGQEGLAGYLIAAGASAVLWPIAGWLLPQATGLSFEAERRAVDWPGLALRIGVHTGPASGGVIGRRKFAFDLRGDTINVASRLEQHGLPGRFHISAQTWEHARHEFASELRGETELRGLGGQQTYLVVGRTVSAQPAAGGARGGRRRS